jgi:hypothetical protein
MVNFIAIGPPKTGTTLLQSLLIQHPDIFLSEKKEIQYFNFYYDKGVQWYHDHFTKAGDHQIIGEISPSYSNSIDTLKRIKDYSISHCDLKIILTYRNPVKRLLSEYYHHIRRGNYTHQSLNEVIKIELNDKTAGRYYKTLRYSSYYTILKEIRSLFGSENILIIDADNELYNSAQLPLTIKKIEDFLNIAHYDKFNFQVEDNASYTPKSYAVQKLLFQKNALKSFSRKMLPSFKLRNHIRSLIRKFNTKQKGYDGKNKIHLNEAQAIYAKYIEDEYKKFLEEAI